MAADHDDARKKEETLPMTWIEWYNALEKPSLTPAAATIGLIWTLLYPVIFISFGFVFMRAFQGKVPRMVAVPFAVNLVANLLFMPIFSWLRNVPLAAADIVIVWATIIWCVVVIWRHYKWVARAVLRVGVAGDRAATFDHGDELGEAMIRLGLCCLSRTAIGFTSIRQYPLPPIFLRAVPIAFLCC